MRSQRFTADKRSYIQLLKLTTVRKLQMGLSDTLAASAGITSSIHTIVSRHNLLYSLRLNAVGDTRGCQLLS